MAIDYPASDQNRPWLAWLVVSIFVLGLLLRLAHAGEIPANIAYELEAAKRMGQGQIPYVDFYFDQLLPVIYFRQITLIVAPLVALLTGAATASGQWFYNAAALGLASVLVTSTLSVVSFLLCWAAIFRFDKATIAVHKGWLLLLAIAIAGLCPSFEFGEQQHLFLLCFLPYFFSRQLVLRGAKLPRYFQLLVATAAAFGASLSGLLLLAVLGYELFEMLARRSLKVVFEATFLSFLAASLLFWLSLFLMSHAAALRLFGLILPLRLTALTHEDLSYYGSFATPDRKIYFYALVFSLVAAFGVVRREPLLRPLAAMAVIGLIIWSALVIGLSADALVLTYFTAMLATVEVYLFAGWITNRYPGLFRRLFRRKKETAFAGIILAASLGFTSFMWRQEVQERVGEKTAATRLQAGEMIKMPALAAVIKANSAVSDPVLIINGKLRPAFPLLTRLGRRAPGYFLGTDMLGMLSTFIARSHFNTDLEISVELAKKIETDLYKQLLADIACQRPVLVFIQGGEMDEKIRQYKVQDYIAAHYDTLGEAKFFTDRLGPNEISERNYTYMIYKLRAAPAPIDAGETEAKPAR